MKKNLIAIGLIAGLVLGGLFAVAFPLPSPSGPAPDEQILYPNAPPGFPTTGPEPLGVPGLPDDGWDEDWEPPDTAFYVYNQEPTNELQTGGSQPYGSMHKVGVDKTVIDAVPDRMADFTHIRDQHADREAFLGTQGLAVANPNGKWNIHICELATIGEEQRYLVIATYGEDLVDAAPYELDDGTEHSFYELWTLQEQGTPPVLLERTLSISVLREGKTTAEVAAEEGQ